MKGSLILVLIFVFGVAVGHWVAIPEILTDGTPAFPALCGLLFCVGMGIGSNADFMTELKGINPRLAWLPLVTIASSWAGCSVASMLLKQRGLTDIMAVGSGFAYYSLSSIFITQYKGVELGTIALLANIIREMATLLLSPAMARLFGPLAPICSGGATTIDTTLPTISQTCGQRYVVVALYHGFVVDFSVPFLVTMWCLLSR